MQAPWYFGADKPTLKHQRPQPEKLKTFARLDEHYQRGVKEVHMLVFIHENNFYHIIIIS